MHAVPKLFAQIVPLFGWVVFFLGGGGGGVGLALISGNAMEGWKKNRGGGKPHEGHPSQKGILDPPRTVRSPPSGCRCSISVDVSDIFYFFPSARRREGGGSIFIENPRRGGGSPGRGGTEGPGGCLRRIGGFWGGGLNIFFRGRILHPPGVVALFSCTKIRD